MEDQQLDPVVLKNAETADKFEATTSINQWMHVPRQKPEEQCFHGPLSQIDPAAAERYVASGGNLLKRKDPEL